ncbi:hypothetical protein BKA62DRAFT_513761 [Auriculariales sp. MPI-PUGE-AT-0066]|nr:hypothetical protein BKA62DRAFT_513761 [Auriculariales sp. MPI-PUGE-AT-0066]
MSKYEESPNGPLVALHYSDDVQLPAINQTLRGPDREKATNKPSVVVPYTFVDFASVQKDVDAIVNAFIEHALQPEGILHQDTLRRGFPSHMIWRPPQAWEHQYPEVYNHLQTMTIPTIPLSEQSEPDLLLYALGSFLTVDSTISKKTGDSHASIYVGIFSNSPVMVLNRPHRLLADTSGAGKTRFISEYLARNGWGFYFTFEVDRTSSPTDPPTSATLLCTRAINDFASLIKNHSFPLSTLLTLPMAIVSSRNAAAGSCDGKQ